VSRIGCSQNYRLGITGACRAD